MIKNLVPLTSPFVATATVSNLSKGPSELPPALETDRLVKARVGAVSYLNSKPLIEDLADRLGQHGELSTDLPSKLADQLHAGQIDIGLIPVFESFQNPLFRRVSSSGIVCKGPVWSVRIFFRGEPRHVASIALDEGSRTSAALSKVLLEAELGKIPETVLLPIDASPYSTDTDAVLLIGDRAMKPERFSDEFPISWDLGEVWWKKTGLPFVFATWIARSSQFATPRLSQLLDDARDFGVGQVAAIADRIHHQYNLTREQCIDYLTNYIRFELDDQALAGMQEFRRMCERLRLIQIRDALSPETVDRQL